jgi:hypothetical protein
MTKHTPGPWEMGPIIAGEDIFILADNRKAAIAKASNLEIYANTFEKLRPLAAECEANARLIAAAPELLEALKAILDETGGMGGPFTTARAAIAKATGG